MSLRAVMALAAERDTIALQYANGFREVLGEGLPAFASVSRPAVARDCDRHAHLQLLARHPDSLILRKHGPSRARGGFSARGRRARSRLARPSGSQAALRRIRRLAAAAEEPDSTRERPPTWSRRRCTPP